MPDKPEHTDPELTHFFNRCRETKDEQLIDLIASLPEPAIPCYFFEQHLKQPSDPGATTENDEKIRADIAAAKYEELYRAFQQIKRHTIRRVEHLNRKHYTHDPIVVPTLSTSRIARYWISR